MKRKYLILFSLSGLVLCGDQLSKHTIFSTLALGSYRVLIPGYVGLTHIRNQGFGFGLLQNAPSSLKELFFIGIPVFALILIVLIFIKLQDNQMLTSVALTTILGGAIGNLIDRLQRGYVIDFLDIHGGDRFHLPPLNIADLSIAIGVGLMFFNTLRQQGESNESSLEK